MKLVLLCGRAGTGKTRRCLEEMSARLKEAPEGAPLLYILPEHATFRRERELADFTGTGGFTRAYVLGFRRLAHRVLLECGGALRPRITDLGKRLLIGKILADCKDQLSVFSQAAKQRNFAETLAGMMEELKSYGVTAGKLQETAKLSEDEAFRLKLMDLSIVCEEFQKRMEGRYVDAEDQMTLLAEKLPASSLAKNAEIWLDGFSWFNPQELDVITAMLTSAQQVTVTLCLEDAKGRSQQEESALFHRQWKTRRTLLALAEDLGAETEEIELVRPWRFEKAAGLLHLEQALFDYKGSCSLANGCVTIAEAANQRREVEGMAADLCRLCREEGYRWRDIAILLRESDAYGALIEGVFRAAQIPYFREGKRSHVHHPLSEVMRSSLEAVRTWQYEPLFRVFKTGFFAVTRDEIDWVENYVLAQGVRGQRWKEVWTYRAAGWPEEELVQLNAVRMLLVKPLMALEQGIRSSKTALEYTTALYDFLVLLEVPQQLEDLAAKAEREGRLDEAREHEQVWDGVVELLEQIVEVCPDAVMRARAYEDLLGEGLEGLSLSLIPPSLDYVTIASVEQNCIENSRAVYLVGMNDGVYPRKARGEGLLGDAERQRLKEADVCLAPGAAEDNFAERFFLYGALTRASEYLWIGYSLADGEGKGLFPSPLISRVRRLLKGIRQQYFPVEVSPASHPLEYLTAGGPAVGALVTSLRAFCQEGEMHPAWQDVYNWLLRQKDLQLQLRTALWGLFPASRLEALPADLARALYAPKKQLKGSVTRFEKFSACPFRFFSEYGLKLKERELYRIQRFDIGKFLHEILRCYGEALLEENRRWEDCSETEQIARCRFIAGQLKERPEYRILESTAQNQNFLERILKTAAFSIRRLSEFASVSAFEPRAYELSFGMGGAFPALSYPLDEGYRLMLTGQIDRIDSLLADGKAYYMVLDYKTGNARLRLIDVFYGLKMQLLTYLLAVSHFAARLFPAEAVPAAMLYCFLKLPVIGGAKRLNEAQMQKAVAEKIKMPGWALADAEVLAQIDGKLGDALGFIKFALKKDADFTQATKPNVKDVEEFSFLLDYAARKFSEIGKRILKGDIRVRPYELGGETGCAYCPYAAVCRFDPTLSCDQFETLPVWEDDCLMKKIRGEVGAWRGQKSK